MNVHSSVYSFQFSKKLSQHLSVSSFFHFIFCCYSFIFTLSFIHYNDSHGVALYETYQFTQMKSQIGAPHSSIYLNRWIERLAEKLSKLNSTSVDLNSISDDIPPPPPLPPLPTYPSINPSNDPSTFSSTNPSINSILPLSIQLSDCDSVVRFMFVYV